MNNKNTISVKDKVILITGANGLIGKEISFTLLNNYAKVILADISTSNFPETKKDLDRICDEGDYLLQELDITDLISISNSIKSVIDKFGRIDVLINNAAIDAKFDNSNTDNIRFENYPLDLLKKSIEVNLFGTIQITQQICKQMLKQGFGNIINIASTYSLVAPNQTLYNFVEEKGTQYKPVDYVATKSVIPNFTKYIATLYAKEGIRCNAIVPHGIYNNHDLEFQEKFSKLSPIGRMCDKSELNGVFLLLCSDASSYMTGSTIVIDGGWTAW